MNNLTDNEYSVGNIIVNSAYWDCECPDNETYIHPKNIQSCGNCGATQEDSPDSRASEVRKMLGTGSWCATDSCKNPVSLKGEVCSECKAVPV